MFALVTGGAGFIGSHTVAALPGRRRGNVHQAMLMRWAARFLAAALWLAPAWGGEIRHVAFFYGAEVPVEALRAFDVAVVEPSHGFAPGGDAAARARFFAYTSLGEVERSRPYFSAIPRDWQIGTNPAWNSAIIDTARPEWPRFFAEQAIAPLWERGYRGFFLDAVDSYQQVAKDAAARGRHEAGLVAAIREIRRRFPEARLILNRGFEILPEIHGELIALAAESLYRAWDPVRRRYVEVAEADRAWLLKQLDEARARYRLPIVAIDYVPPRERALARETARRIARHGFVPWVASAEHDALGVGAREVLPRRVLMLYDGRDDEDLIFAKVHRWGCLPLNHLGYVCEYHDARRGLPEARLAGRYAGIVTWFSDEVLEQSPKLGPWIARQIADGVRVAVFDYFGYPLSEISARRLGLKVAQLASQPAAVEFARRDALVGFEIQPLPDVKNFRALELRPGAEGRALLSLRGADGRRFDAVAITAWGGYALAPYAVVELPEVGERRAAAHWVIDPLAFLKAALALPDMPVPDTTTDVGRRMLLVHVDGDGFPSLAEMGQQRLLAGEVMLNELLARYRVPTTVSMIQGEIAENGLFPHLSPRLEDIARRIYALPHVELASHSYSHPFHWENAEAGKTDAKGPYHLDLKGYRFELEAEIRGSIRYINERLAPPGKRVKVFQWTGNAAPGARAIRMTYEAGVLNMNGGDTLITRSHPSLTAVAPLGVARDGHFQVFAPNTNENLYTNQWIGPFYGYERAVESFELTDRPRRLKPLNIYYHSYSASKHASLEALKKTYEWALARPLHPVFASEYIAKVLAFNRMQIVREGDAWLVFGDGALRTLRAPASLGVPDLAASDGAAGYAPGPEGHYVHFAGAEARLVFTPQPQREPHLEQANARVARLARAPGHLDIDLEGHMPLEFTLVAPGGCRISAAGAPLKPSRSNGERHSFELRQNRVSALQVSCQR